MAFGYRETYGTLAELLRRLRPSKAAVTVTLVCLLASSAFEGATVAVLVPLLSLLTGTGGETGGAAGLLGGLLTAMPPNLMVIALGATVVLMVAMKHVLSYLGHAVFGRMRGRALVELRRRLLERVLHAPPATLEAHTTGETVTVFLLEAYRANRVFDSCIALIQRSMIALSYLAAMVLISWRLTLATILLGVMLAASVQWLGKRVLRLGRELTLTSGQVGRQVSEIVGGLRVVRATATEARHEKAFAEPNRLHAEADVGSSLAIILQQGSVEVLGVAGAMGLIALAYHFWLQPGELEVSAFLAFGFGLLRLLPVLSYVYGTQAVVTSTVGSIEKVLSWLDLPSYPERPFGKLTVPKLTRGIEFQNIGFSYREDHAVLRDLSFFLPAGETLAVLGTSGAGKSTLASILLRLREPTSGRVTFDGIDYWEFSPEAFHDAVGVVEQEPFLFNATIAENVACEREGITREAIQRALRSVQLGDVVDRLPLGIDTVLAERGTTLSGGQRQRLAIARAIVRDPQILVLDEPTSALDPETEQEVVEAIDSASIGRTTFIITHRETAARHATWRLDLSKGRFEQVKSSAPAGGAPGSAER